MRISVLKMDDSRRKRRIDFVTAVMKCMRTLSVDEFRLIVTRGSRIDPTNENLFREYESNRVLFISELEESGQLTCDNVAYLIYLFSGIGRLDLAIFLFKFQVWSHIRRMEILGHWLRENRSCLALSMLVVLLLMFLLNRMIPGLIAVKVAVLFSAFFGLTIFLTGSHHSIWYWYRFWKCTQGGNRKSRMRFTFTTFDVQVADVENNIEFLWENLKKKFGITFNPHSDPRTRYYINTNRVVYGDIRRVGNALDGIKPIRGAEFFAVPPPYDSVCYHSHDNWVPYASANNIRFTYGDLSVPFQSVFQKIGAPSLRDGD